MGRGHGPLFIYFAAAALKTDKDKQCEQTHGEIEYEQNFYKGQTVIEQLCLYACIGRQTVARILPLIFNQF